MTNNTSPQISTPRDLSKTHKRAYIVSVRNRDTGSDNIFYVKNEWEAQGHLDADRDNNTHTTYYPCMVSNELYATIS